MLTIVMMCHYFVVILSVVMLNVVVPLKSLMSETKLGTDPTNNFTSVVAVTNQQGHTPWYELRLVSLY
jgi:hypothetical protein